MPLIKEIDYGTPASKAETTVTLTIDAEKVTVPAGTSIMRAAMEAGIKIPKLCATDMMESFGSCRVCLVEIDGRAGTPASCTTPVAEGMVVHTQTPRLAKLRRGVMELYASDYPEDFLKDTAHGDSEFFEVIGAVGLREIRYGREGATHLAEAKDESNPYFTYDPTTSPKSLLTAEYKTKGGVTSARPMRVVRWPLNGDGSLKADSSGQVQSTVVYGTNLTNV